MPTVNDLQNKIPGGAEGEIRSANTDASLDAANNGILSDTLRIESEFDRVLAYWQEDRVREQRNWNLYAGLDLGQYTEEDKAQAQLEGRDLATFNIITQKCDSLAGYILKNLFDSDFVPVEGEESIYTTILKGMYLSDKQMMDWERSYAKLVNGGLVHSGVEEIYIDRKFHPLGNIAFRCHLPGYVLFDPRWKTDSVKDCQMAWVASYLTASQICEMWPEKSKLLNFVDRDIERVKTIGEYFDAVNDKSVTPMFDLDPANSGFNYYRIIRKFEMVTEEVSIEYDSITGIDLPIGTDYAKKLAFLNKNRPDWEGDQIKKRTERRRVCMVTTVCRQLDQNDPIEKKPSEIQVGRLPLMRWTATAINGRCRGIVDLLADLQYKINYREELITNIIETEAVGAKLADPLLFNDDEDLKLAFERDVNKPHKVIWTAPGALGRNLDPRPVSKATLPQDARDQLMRMFDYADRLSKSPAVFDARSEKSGESGYLFAQKARVAEQQSYTLFASLKSYEQEKAEMYMEQAKLQYTIGGIERRFLVRDGSDQKSVVINRRYFETVKGEELERVENDFANLPRHKVVISESPSSTTNRLITRAVSTELLRVIPPEAIGTRQVFTSALVESLDTFNAKDKEKLAMYREIEEEIVLETLKGQLMKLKVGNIQGAQVLKQAQDQAKAQAAGATGGAAEAPAAPQFASPAAQPPSSPSPSPMSEAPATPPGQANLPQERIGSMEGGPVPPEKSMGYQGGGPVAGPAQEPVMPPSGMAPAPAAAAPPPSQAPQEKQPSPAEIIQQASAATGGKVTLTISSDVAKEKAKEEK